MDEKLDVLDGSGHLTGEVAWKSEAHRLGLWHRCFHCWIVDPGGPSLLVQRRAAGKDTWPGRLDVTAAGHLRSGEEPLDGIREIEEELGLQVSPGSLIPLGTRRVEQEIPDGCDRELHEIFLLLDATPPEGLCLQPGEVEAVLRMSFEDVEGMRGGEPVYAEEWRGGKFRTIQVCFSDFVPNSDEYLLRVARAARGVLGGESPGRVF